ncbi:SET domain-containing protein [Zeaxanthinibacter sp. PT1]|uniref:SET domain-containing protein n=1 Tax=Zeaxanthinibacter TaxID=561554 RepID=UPI00234A8AB3|nr:SET domain-containing protein [Zeaxanthinibacter sp. PT1]MDC6351590.1 SET domain-containing protein [Zeaxanthinibacter sp. PT1]
MIHPHTSLQFINDVVGHGVVATKLIPAGTITWVLDDLDREFTPKQYQKMNAPYKEILDIYTYRNNKGNYILCWDNGRFVNHSFKANCLTTAYDFEIAIRDIQPGEQLTDDYGYLNIQSPFRGVDEGTRRKVVYPDDLLRYYKSWDKKIGAVFHRIPELDQPLKPLLKKEVVRKIEAVLSGEQAIASILNNYYKAK